MPEMAGGGVRGCLGGIEADSSSRILKLSAYFCLTRRSVNRHLRPEYLSTALSALRSVRRVVRDAVDDYNFSYSTAAITDRLSSCVVTVRWNVLPSVVKLRIAVLSSV